MVYLIIGENAFVMKHELARIVKQSDAAVEHVDGAQLTIAQLADLVRAQVLFASSRVIVCRGLSENKPVWDKLGEWIEEVPESTILVLIEAKADKRTKAYKAIVKHATLIVADQLTDRDWRRAESWLEAYARAHKLKLTAAQLSNMVQRAYVPDTKPGRQLIDQQLIATAVESLAALGSVDDDAIETVMPTGSQGTVFDIVNHALTGDDAKLKDLMRQLRHQDEALAVFPSLMSQWTQLVEVGLVGERSTEELGIHPYVAQKLAQLAKKVTHDDMKRITALGARLDADMKHSTIEPWDAVDRFVLALTIRK